MSTYKLTSLALLFGACLGSDASDTSSAINGANDHAGGGGGVRGAIFTTTVDGTVVNENHYAAKTDVYLDGGPRGHAPAKAAALAKGDYYFQVTDPSGKTVLSSDDIKCRKIRVSEDGVIVKAYPGPMCQHATGTDSDDASLGALTVQLAPFADTPNPGGVYKVWVTPVHDYDGKFVHSKSKTDNFKVAPNAPPPPPATCGNGHVDSGEQCDDGNTMNGDGCSAGCTTEAAPCCGDGHLDAGEECDDGNTSNNDGCSSACQIEACPQDCPNSPT
jgi:cysteine-rich repeat protein